MTPPARNIVITSKIDDAVFFCATCDDTHFDHDHIVVELDENKHYVTISIYQDLEWAQLRTRDESPALKRFLIRLKNAMKYLFTGHVKAEGRLVMSYETLQDYIEVLEKAAVEIRKKTKANM